MEVNFQEALEALGGKAAIARIANESRAPSDYLLTTILPERRLPDYEANDGSMTVRTTMAGAVGMDSAYPEGGLIDVSTFAEQIAKIAIQSNLSERALRTLRQFVERALLPGGGGNAGDIVQGTILNFVNKILLQAHFDRQEWLRGQALFHGEIDWRFNGSNVVLQYGIPAENTFDTRTGTDAYGGSTSVFWDDMKEARRILGAAYQVSIATRATIEEVIYNDANSINVLDITGGRYRIQRFRGSLERPTTDAREVMTLVEYDAEGEVFDPANEGQTVKVPFIPDGVIGNFARGGRSRELIPDEGATEDPDNDLALGYTHLGPTEEGGGTPGLWARVYTPDDMPMQLRGQAAGNILPVVRNPDKIVLMSTDLS